MYFLKKGGLNLRNGKFFKLGVRDLKSIGATQERVKRKLSKEIRYYELTYD